MDAAAIRKHDAGSMELAVRCEREPRGPRFEPTREIARVQQMPIASHGPRPPARAFAAAAPASCREEIECELAGAACHESQHDTRA
jgi:hypothetical protein